MTTHIPLHALGASLGIALLTLLLLSTLLLCAHNLRRRRAGYTSIPSSHIDRRHVKRESAEALMTRLNKAEAHMSIPSPATVDGDQSGGRSEAQLSVLGKPTLSTVDEEVGFLVPEGHASVVLGDGVDATQDLRCMAPEANIEMVALGVGRREGNKGW